jgi:DNA-3-methyladenine glycosylase II
MRVDPLKYLSRADPRLGVVIKTVGKYSIKLRTDAFQSLVEAIIFQQLAGVAANVIYTRFMKYYNNMMPAPFDIVSTSDMELRSKVGLSSKKVLYLKDLATKIEEHKLKLDLLPTMSDEDVINQLIQVKGIGRWTAEMFLIFCLGRPDVLPRYRPRNKESHAQNILIVRSSKACRDVSYSPAMETSQNCCNMVFVEVTFKI